MINNNQLELYMNRERDCLTPLDISFPDEGAFLFCERFSKGC